MSSTGQIVGAIIGGVIGGITTGGSPGGILKGAAYGASIGGALDPAAVPGYDGPRLSDATEQTSGYGVGLNEVDGKAKVSGHVFWIENNSRREVAKKEDTGGKGGGGGGSSTTYSYFGTFAVMLTNHQVQCIERMWDIEGLLLNTGGTDVDTAFATSEKFPLSHLYDVASEDILKSALAVTPTPGSEGEVRLFPGFDDQPVCPRMEADLGVGSTPAMRGCAYLVFYDWPLPQEYAQSIQGAQISAEVIRSAVAGVAVLLNEIKILHPAPLIGGYCQYLTPDLTRVYYAEDPYNNSANPAEIFGVQNIGPFGLEPRVVGWPNLAEGDPIRTVTQIQGKGLTDVDIGPIGTSDAQLWISDFPGRLSYYPLHWARKGSLGNGVWFGTDTTGKDVYFGFEETDSYITVTCPTNIYDVAIDEDGNGIAVSNNKIDVYDQTLTVIRTIDTTGIPGFSGFAPDDLWVCYDAPTLYVCKGAANAPTNIYPIDMATETPGTLVSLRNMDSVYPSSTPSRLYSNINIHGSIVTRFTGGYSNRFLIDFDSIVEHYRMPTPSGDGEDLATVVRRRLERSELIESGDIDATDLVGTVRGFKSQGIGSVRSQLSPMMLAYNFDLIQDGYIVKAVARGNSSVVTIDPDDMDARAFGSKPGVALSNAREMDTQLPSKVIVLHLDKARDYEVNEQYSQTMAASSSVNIEEITLPGVFTPNEAAGIAETIWARRWLEREEFSFSLPQTYRQIQAADVITATMTYGTFEFFVKTVNYTVDGRVECSTVLNDSAVYTPNAVGGDGIAGVTTVGYSGNSVFNLLDIPLVQEVYDTTGFPAAMSGYATGWPGGVLAKSTDSGQTWNPIQGWSSPVTAGVATTILPDHDCFVTDRTNTLTVQFYQSNMAITSITETQMMTGLNWFAYGVNGRWEIGRCVNATLNADGKYTMDTLIRGARGTEWAAALHEEGDIFVFISDADMAFIGADVNSIGASRDYRGVTTGRDIDSASTKPFTYNAVNLKPLSPVQLSGALNVNDWDLAWVRRSRFSTSWWTTGVARPLGETTESWEIDIMNGAVVVRTLTAVTNAVTYTSADQVTDFGSNQTALTFRVYQLSTTVGRGYVAEVTV